jgi:hypothetical protein
MHISHLPYRLAVSSLAQSFFVIQFREDCLLSYLSVAQKHFSEATVYYAIHHARDMHSK